MTIDERTRRLWTYLPSAQKWAFFSCVVVGYLVHLYAFTNLIPNGDGLSRVFDYQQMTVSGRWFLHYASVLNGFTQMPADIVEDSGDEKAKRLPAQEIHVILDVPDSQARPVEVLGIRKIELANFWAGREDDRTKKCRYLYRDPVSPASTWRYSPLYKLGKGVADGRQSLLGEGNWKEDKDSRFYK